MTPTDVIERFAQLLSTGDVGAAVELYEPEAAFAVQPGELAVGRTAIEAALVQFAALRPMLTSDIQEVVDIGDLALVVNRWTLDGRDPDGTPVHLEGRSADVLRRAETGEWRIAIDDPWGGAIGT